VEERYRLWLVVRLMKWATIFLMESGFAWLAIMKKNAMLVLIRYDIWPEDSEDPIYLEAWQDVNDEPEI
jgi:hypothetical protein